MNIGPAINLGESKTPVDEHIHKHDIDESVYMWKTVELKDCV